jgi:cell division septation protein DedD
MSMEGHKPLRLVVDPEDRGASREAGRRAAGGAADAMPEDDCPDSESEFDDEAEETEARAGGRGRGGALRGGIALLVLAVFGGAAWYAYNWGVGEVAPDALPVVEAEPGPIKSRPESPGGMEVPYQDQAILNDAVPDPDNPQVERLLPPPEVPAPPEPPPQAVSEVPESKMPTQLPAGESAPAEPSEATAAAAPEPPPAAAEVPAEVPAEVAAAEAPDETAPEAPAPAAAAAAPSAPAAGDWVVQLASFKSRDAASGEWARLQGKFPELLGRRAPDVQSAEIAGQGTFYRLRAGYFDDRDAAVRFCDRLKAGGQDCLAAKR